VTADARTFPAAGQEIPWIEVPRSMAQEEFAAFERSLAETYEYYILARTDTAEVRRVDSQHLVSVIRRCADDLYGTLAAIDPSPADDGSPFSKLYRLACEVERRLHAAQSVPQPPVAESAASPHSATPPDLSSVEMPVTDSMAEGLDKGGSEITGASPARPKCVATMNWFGLPLPLLGFDCAAILWRFDPHLPPVPSCEERPSTCTHHEYLPAGGEA